MPNKLVFFGRDNVGKSTLIKLFFEGKNAIELLKTPLPPTIGITTKVFDLSQQIGVFDLPGQEFDHIIAEGGDIFIESDVIIMMVDSTQKFTNNLQLIENCIDVRDKNAPDAYIFVLFHKKDLLSEQEMNELQNNIKNFPIITQNMTIHSTSILEIFQIDLLDIMIEVFKKLSAYTSDFPPFELDMLRMNYSIFNLMAKNKYTTFEDINNIAYINSDILLNQLNYLIEQGYVQSVSDGSKNTYSLNDKGGLFLQKYKNFLNSTISKDFPVEFSLKDLKGLDLEDISQDVLFNFAKKLIFGLIVMDNIGRVLYFGEFSKGAVSDQFFDADIKKDLDLDLVAMYLTALQKFSDHIKFDTHEGFILEKNHLRIHLILKNKLNFVCFCSSKFKTSVIKEEFRESVDYFIESFPTQIKSFLKTGALSSFNSFAEYISNKMLNATRKILIDLKENEKDYASSQEPNLIHYKKLYLKIDEYLHSSNKFSSQQSQQYKIELFDALLNKKFETLHKLEEKILNRVE